MPRIPGRRREFFAALCEALITSAELRFRLDLPDKEGHTQREMLEGLEKRTGRRHPELDVPPPPECLQYLLVWFGELHGGRPNTGFGPGLLPAAEILAWCELKRQRLLSWEFDLIRRMDRAWIKVRLENS